MAKKTLTQNFCEALSPLKTLSLPLKLWLIWLAIQGFIQAIGYDRWLIGGIYMAHLYGFSRLATESERTHFNQRLLFWLSCFVVFLYGRGLVWIYGGSTWVVQGVLTPTQLLLPLAPLAVESFCLIGLKRAQKGVLISPQVTASDSTPTVVIDMDTGEILKEMT